mmetsp:Transcript_2734/g.7981  ORF Transcript_2734/g.7981 Transcript_2734/m.7981 type:complete len:334 (+) Transcript_2734:1863-2864(+)
MADPGPAPGLDAVASPEPPRTPTFPGLFTISLSSAVTPSASSTIRMSRERRRRASRRPFMHIIGSLSMAEAPSTSGKFDSSFLASCAGRALLLSNRNVSSDNGSSLPCATALSAGGRGASATLAPCSFATSSRRARHPSARPTVGSAISAMPPRGRRRAAAVSTRAETLIGSYSTSDPRTTSAWLASAADASAQSHLIAHTMPGAASGLPNGPVGMPHKSAVDIAQWRARGSRSTRVTTDAPATEAVSPATPRPAPSSMTRFPLTRSGSATMCVASAPAAGQTLAQLTSIAAVSSRSAAHSHSVSGSGGLTSVGMGRPAAGTSTSGGSSRSPP